MADNEPKRKEYFERGLDDVIGKMRYVQSLDLRKDRRDFKGEGINAIVDMRISLLGLGLELIGEMNRLPEADELWKKYERVHKMQETINWFYSDCIEIERLELLKDASYRISGRMQSRNKEK